MVAFQEEGPYYATELRPWMVNTQGGPVHNEEGMVIDINGEPIPHLYEAGEMGCMFSGIYQGAGNIADNIAFGRISGTNAAMPKDDAQPAEDLPIDLVVPTPKEAPTFETAEGEYIGSAEGICGPLYVKVKLADDGTIAQVTDLDNMETDTFGGLAIERMSERFVGLSGDDVYDVDGVTLATFTSVAIRLAVADALSHVA